MADQYLLGQQDAGWTSLHEINAPGGSAAIHIWAVGDTPLAKLRKFPARLGYAGKG